MSIDGSDIWSFFSFVLFRALSVNGALFVIYSNDEYVVFDCDDGFDASILILFALENLKEEKPNRVNK